MRYLAISSILSCLFLGIVSCKPEKIETISVEHIIDIQLSRTRMNPDKTIIKTDKHIFTIESELPLISLNEEVKILRVGDNMQLYIPRVNRAYSIVE